MSNKYSTEIINPFKSIKGDGTEAICVTTNGIVMQNGKAVMGAGIAKFVRDTFPGVDSKLGDFLSKYGNRAFNLGTQEYEGKKFRLISFPTKNDWKDKSDLSLIEKSANELVSISDKFDLKKVYLPAPGCSHGQLKWKEVEKKLSSLDDRFTITSLDKKTFKKDNPTNGFSP